MQGFGIYQKGSIGKSIRLTNNVEIRKFQSQILESRKGQPVNTMSDHILVFTVKTMDSTYCSKKKKSDKT